MKTLIDRLKPEVKSKLEQSKLLYPTSVGTIYEKLKECMFYDDLPIGVINSIYTFAEINLVQVSVWDLRHGDNILEPRTDD